MLFLLQFQFSNENYVWLKNPLTKYDFSKNKKYILAIRSIPIHYTVKNS